MYTSVCAYVWMYEWTYLRASGCVYYWRALWILCCWVSVVPLLGMYVCWAAVCCLLQGDYSKDQLWYIAHLHKDDMARDVIVNRYFDRVSGPPPLDESDVSLFPPFFFSFHMRTACKSGRYGRNSKEKERKNERQTEKGRRTRGEILWAYNSFPCL